MFCILILCFLFNEIVLMVFSLYINCFEGIRATCVALFWLLHAVCSHLVSPCMPHVIEVAKVHFHMEVLIIRWLNVNTARQRFCKCPRCQNMRAHDGCEGRKKTNPTRALEIILDVHSLSLMFSCAYRETIYGLWWFFLYGFTDCTMGLQSLMREFFP